MVHLHCIVPGGGLTKDGKWKNAKSKGKYLFDVKAMVPVFRAKFTASLRESKVVIPQKVYDQVFKKKWVIYAKPVFAKPEFVIEYLGRYSHKIAISNHRIIAIDRKNKKVTFTAKDYRHGNKKTKITLSTVEFIRRFGLHVLPKGFTRIRHFGILSSSWKKEKLPKLQILLATTPTPDIHSKEPLQHRRCTSCKKGVLETILTFDSRGPPFGFAQGPPENWKKLNTNKKLIMSV